VYVTEDGVPVPPFLQSWIENRVHRSKLGILSRDEEELRKDNKTDVQITF
jgi:hypothetical protein